MTNNGIRDKVLEAVEVEWFDKDQILLCCIKYMSENEIRDMLEANELHFPEDGTDEDNEITEL
jgi:hypothetical protein